MLSLSCFPNPMNPISLRMIVTKRDSRSALDMWGLKRAVLEVTDCARDSQPVTCNITDF